MGYVLIAMLGMFIGFRMSQILCNRKTKILHAQLDKYQKEKDEKYYSRRDFIKTAGIASLAALTTGLPGILSAEKSV